MPFGVRNTDSLINEGVITFSDFEGRGAIFNKSHFNNQGSIYFDNVRGGILNQDSIFNTRLIRGDNILEFPGFRNSSLDANLLNKSSGILRCKFFLFNR